MKFVLFYLAALVIQSGARPQNEAASAPPDPRSAIRTGFTRDSVRVGDLVGVALQLDVAAGATLSGPDTLDLTADVENAAPKRVQIDTLPNGLLRYQLIYPITAWRPGPVPLPSISLVLRAGEREQVIQVALPTLAVLTVLPADTAGVEPKPPRDVWGASRLWWPLLLAVLLLLLIIAVAVWWWRRRPRRQDAAVQSPIALIRPSDWALREIDRLLAAHYIERGDYQRFYVELSGILRGFLERTDHNWGGDLTTRELADHLYAVHADARIPIDVLSRADLVKFARQQHGAEQAARDIADSRQWVEHFAKPVAEFAEAA